jgi:CO/xanthine dehydrogenase FAD-binding subunit
MTQHKTYHRPTSVSEAISLAAQDGAVLIAGGTQSVPDWRDSAETFVDLQAVGLDQITVNGNKITIGAMTRLQSVVDHPEMPTLIKQMAHREAPNTFRNMATVGGTIATADPESELYAAMLVHAATVTTQSATGERSCRLSEGLQLGSGELITSVSIQTGGESAAHSVGRTPADKPIVAVIGRKTDSSTLLAACGVADRPILIDDDTVLNPSGDFRGSAEYRTQMAKLLTKRVVATLNGGN